MTPSGLIPEAGMGEMPPEEWIAVVAELAQNICDLTVTSRGLSEAEAIERVLVIDHLKARLIALLCTPEAQAWLATIKENARLIFAGVRQ